MIAYNSLQTVAQFCYTGKTPPPEYVNSIDYPPEHSRQKHS